MTDNDPKGSMVRLMGAADYVTLLNAALGLAAVVAAFEGAVHAAYVLILLAILVDGADGALARAGHGGPLGPMLDTLSDLVSFVVAPGLLLYLEYFPREVFPWVPLPSEAMPDVWTRAGVLAVAMLFVAAGMLRLARFELEGGGGRNDLFHGLTTPGGAIIVVAVVLLGRVWPQTAWLPALSLAIVAVAAFLMASRRVMPKLRGPLAVPSVLVILVAAVVGPAWWGFGPVLLLAFSVAYVLLGPAYARGRPTTEAESS